MKKLDIVVLGEKPQGERWLKFLIQSNLFNIKAGVGRKKFNNAWWGEDNFEAILAFHNIPIVAIEELHEIEYDIIWSLMYGFKIPKELIEKATYQGLNLHETPLPLYKGCNGISYALLENKSTYGTTFQQLGANIDEGDIYDQEIFPITPTMTAKELYTKTQSISDLVFKRNLQKVATKTLTKIKENLTTPFNARGDILEKKILNFQTDMENFDTIYSITRAFDFTPFEPVYFQFNNEKFYFMIKNSLGRFDHEKDIQKNIHFDNSLDILIKKNSEFECFTIKYDSLCLLVMKESLYIKHYEIFSNNKYLRELDFFGTSKKRIAKDRVNILKKNKVLASDNYMDFGYDYFDNNEQKIGYGGYNYDGRYKEVAQKIIDFYGLKKGDKILEFGPAKGFVLIEFQLLGMDVYGLEKSTYAIQNAHEALQGKIVENNQEIFPFEDDYFDLVLSKEVIPHVHAEDLDKTIQEINRVGKRNFFLEIQVAITDEEKELVLQWDPTHITVEAPYKWNEILIQNNFKGDIHYKMLF